MRLTAFERPVVPLLKLKRAQIITIYFIFGYSNGIDLVIAKTLTHTQEVLNGAEAISLTS